MNTEVQDAFVGIDVAFAKRKALPVSVCVTGRARILEILPLRVAFEKPPLGRGNVLALDDQVRRQFAVDVLVWLEKLECSKKLRIRRVAIDAPSDYCRDGSGRRSAERALDAHDIRCFPTPTEEQFREMVERSKKFLADGGKPSRMRYGFQLWMLVGFELFRTLKQHYECIETYPQAVVHQLKCADQHKSTVQGLESQVQEGAKVLGLPATDFRARLLAMGFGKLHDRLDAFLSAWVASLDEKYRKPFGTPPDDVIWVPNIRGAPAECTTPSRSGCA
jgi:predicted nuclease with RNAse H fold